MPDFKRFECTNCTVCCQGVNKGERKVNKDDLGVYYTLAQNARLISLWRWEADRLREKAEALGKELVIRPISFIVDKKNDKAVIILWFLDHETCQFFDGKTCSIWEARPFTCKAFPLYGHMTGIGLSSLCPDVVRPPMGDDPKENGRLITDIYPDEVLNLFQDMNIFKTVFGLIRDLEENEVIEWDKEATLERAGELIGSAEDHVDLFDLVVDQQVLTRERLQQIFKELDSVESIRGNVELNVTRDMLGM